MLGFGPFVYLYIIEGLERKQDIRKTGSGNGIRDGSGKSAKLAIDFPPMEIVHWCQESEMVIIVKIRDDA